MPIHDLIQVRRDSSSEWSSINPILSSGEFGLNLDTGFIKIGDGFNNWNDLPYFISNGLLGLNSSTDGEIAIFDGTTGQILKNSGVLIDSSGNISATNLSGINTGDTIATTGTILFGRGDGSGSGPIQEIILGTNLSMSGNTLNAAVGGGGDVTGASSSTDNAIVRFDSTSGKLIQDSLVIIDDSGNISATNFSGSSSGSNTGDQTITLTTDVTGSGTGTFSAIIVANAVTTSKITDGNVTYAKIQNVSTTDKILGRSSIGAGVIEEITCTASARTFLSLNAVKGDLVYGSATDTWNKISIGGAGYLLYSDGTDASWISPTTAGLAKSLDTLYVGTTSIALNRSSGSQSLTGITSIDGNAATATILQTARNINGVSFNGSADITVTAAAGTLTGTTLNSTVVTSSLTTLGELSSLIVTDYQPVFQYSGGAAGLYIKGARAGAGNAFLSFYHSRGTVVSPTIANNNDNNGAIYAWAYDSSAYRINAAILMSVDGTPGSGDMPGRIRLQVAADGGTTLATALDIRQNLAATFGGTLTVTGDITGTTAATGTNSTVMASTAFVTTASSYGTYQTLLNVGASHTAAKVAGTYALGYGDVAAVSGTGTLYPIGIIGIYSADFPTVNGLSAKLRIRAQVNCNDVAPTGNFTFGLYPITRPASSGAAGLCIYTIGTVVSGSNGATVSTPAADSQNSLVSSDFALPSDGQYIIAVVTTGTIATSAHVHLNAQLQFHYA